MEAWQALQFFQSHTCFDDEGGIDTLTRVLSIRVPDEDLQSIVDLRCNGFLGTQWTVPRHAGTPADCRFATERI